MFRRLRCWWWAYQRTLDKQILWPQCKKVAPTLDHAKVVFAVHAFNDSAWIDFYGKEQLIIEIGAFK